MLSKLAKAHCIANKDTINLGEFFIDKTTYSKDVFWLFIDFACSLFYLIVILSLYF